MAGNADGTSVRVPPRCLSLHVSGDWAHFRRPEGNVVKRTYQIPPRTTVAGMLAAMAGLPRDSYYGLFAKDSSAIAIQPRFEPASMNVPTNTLDTMDDMRKASSGDAPTIYYPDTSGERKQHNYEFLVDPEYRIDVWVEDNETYETLRTHLEEGTSIYTPSLGLSELLASVKYRGEHHPESVEADAETAVDSVIWGEGNAVPVPGATCKTERSQSFMTRTDDSATLGGTRTVEAYTTVVYPVDESTIEASSDTRLAEFDGRTVMFG
jgi:CRISPR-associated protein Cas5h